MYIITNYNQFHDKLKTQVALQCMYKIDLINSFLHT